MKLSTIAALVGTIASASAEYATLRGSPEKYSPPEVETDVKTLWDELAAEAAFMQVMISEKRTTAQCIEGCNNNNSPNFNRARCRKNCKQIRDKGGNSSTRTLNCSDCRVLPQGGRRRERCMDACRGQQERTIERCMDAFNCGECRAWCATGNELDRCLDEVGNCGGSDRNFGNCRNPERRSDCDDCRNDSDYQDCLDEFRGGGNNRNFDDCRDASSCSECKSWCTGQDKQDCKFDYCSAEELLEGAQQQ